MYRLPGLLELAIHAQVMAPEDAGTGYENADRRDQRAYLVVAAGAAELTGASTAWRQRL